MTHVGVWIISIEIHCTSFYSIVIDLPGTTFDLPLIDRDQDVLSSYQA